jgi:hypothetical protein
LWSEVPTQVVYQTNADYTATEEALATNKLIIVAPTRKGLLWFRFVDSRTIFQLSPMGKLQVRWADLNEKRTLYRLVKNLLVASPNEKLVVKPLKQQLWIEYPVPDPFKIYWCDELTEYTLKKPAEPKQHEKPSSFVLELGKVRRAVEQLRREFCFFREPTFNEVVLKSGCLDAETVKIGLFLAGWKEQSMEADKWNAERAINLSAWLRFKQIGKMDPSLIAIANEAIDKAPIAAIKKAQLILKNYPQLVPTIHSIDLSWPDETKQKWIQTFGSNPPPEQRWNISQTLRG